MGMKRENRYPHSERRPVVDEDGHERVRDLEVGEGWGSTFLQGVAVLSRAGQHTETVYECPS